MRICGMASAVVSTFCPLVRTSAWKVYECVRGDRFWRGWALALVAEATPHPLASSLLLTAAALQMRYCLPSIDAEKGDPLRLFRKTRKGNYCGITSTTSRTAQPTPRKADQRQTVPRYSRQGSRTSHLPTSFKTSI